MNRTLCILSLAAALTTVAAAQNPPAAPRYVNSRAVVLNFGVSNEVAVDTVRTWYSRDAGQNWNEIENVRTGPGSIRCDAPTDGKYWFYIVLENKGGASSPPPTAGTTPHLAVRIDATPPTLQLHRVEPITDPDRVVGLRIEASLLEENLDPAGVRIFYRHGGQATWTDAGPVLFVDGTIDWQPPTDEPGPLDVRLVVVDRAGNTASDEIAGVEIPRPQQEIETERDRLRTETAREYTTDAENGAPIAVAPVTVEPVQRVTIDEGQSGEARRGGAQLQAQFAKEDMVNSGRLREQASTFLAKGQFALAGARLQEALKLTPDNPDLMVDLGSVYYRTRQYDQAYQQFQRADELTPGHIGALEGLALVAATQNKYPLAKEHLEKLLKLRPDAADHWLHYGDVEHMLGNQTAAQTAWQKALALDTADDTLRQKAEKRLEYFQTQKPVAK